MGRSWSSAGAADIIEDYSRSNTFHHTKSGFYYTMLRRDGKLFQRRYLLDSDKRPFSIHEEEVSYVVGSGNHARSYLRHHANGVITQLPVTWYSQAKRWGMSPGYDVPDHLDFTRAIPQSCVFCHTAYPLMQPERVDDAHYFPYSIPGGIGCERCHGPGAAHVQVASRGEPQAKLRQAIYNPARDTLQAQRTVCYQCHMENSVNSLGTRVLKPGRDVFSFRPGQPFSDYAVQFSLEGTDTRKFQVVQHADLMEASRCFQASQDRMTCTSCHDPHRKVSPQEAVSYYRQRCLTCHSTGQLRRHTAVQLAGNCAGCHMPRGVPTNGGHTVFTNHRIGIYPRASRSAARRDSSPIQRLEFREADRGLSENEKLFFLAAAYLDAPVEELSHRPDLAKQGVQLMQDYLTRTASQELNRPYRSRAEVLLGKGHQALNEVEQALKHYENSVQLKEGQLQPIYNLALLEAKQGKLSLAARHFSEVLERFPKHVPSIHGLGALAEAAGRQSEAVRYFQQAIALFPNASASHYRLAQIALGRQETEKAAEELQKCLALNPRDLPVLMDLGQLFARQSRLAESRQSFEQALRVDPSREEIYNALSVVIDSQGNSVEAVALLKIAVAKGIAGEVTFMNLGNLCARKEDFPQAIRFFETARKKNPANAKALFALAICHLKVGAPAKAKTFLEQVIHLDPQNAEARQALKQLTGR